MPRYRNPAAVAEITGDTIKHPERHKGRTDLAVAPIGPAPDGLDADHAQAWEDLTTDIPWLTVSDRHTVDLTARLLVLTRQPECPLGAYAQLRLCLASLGGTPVDRTRVQIEPDEPTNPADEFLN